MQMFNIEGQDANPFPSVRCRTGIGGRLGRTRGLVRRSQTEKGAGIAGSLIAGNGMERMVEGNKEAVTVLTFLT